MNNERILYYLGILENGALNYYQTVETIRIASQSIQNYIEQLEQQCKNQKEVIDKIKDFCKDDKNFEILDLYSQDIVDEIQAKLLQILEDKEVSE